MLYCNSCVMHNIVAGGNDCFSTRVFSSWLSLYCVPSPFFFCTLPFEKTATFSFCGYKCGLLNHFIRFVLGRRMKWEGRKGGSAECFFFPMYIAS